VQFKWNITIRTAPYRWTHKSHGARRPRFSLLQWKENGIY